MRGRVQAMFEGLKGIRAALIAYATGYYPDRESSERIIRTMLDSGADAVEIGLPFSDPVMDGPVIQESSAAALSAGATPAGVLDLVSSLRAKTDRPLLVMSYYNPIFSFGVKRFAREAAAAGVDGLIVPDLPVEEMGPLREACADAGVDTVAFCAPTTSSERIEAVSEASSGFLYCIPRLGTTGAREEMPEGLPAFLSRVRSRTGRPVAVGVGISTPAQCAAAGRLADGVIVGSALMSAVLEGGGSLEPLSALVRGMAAALVPGAA